MNVPGVRLVAVLSLLLCVVVGAKPGVDASDGAERSTSVRTCSDHVMLEYEKIGFVYQSRYCRVGNGSILAAAALKCSAESESVEFYVHTEGLRVLSDGIEVMPGVADRIKQGFEITGEKQRVTIECNSEFVLAVDLETKKDVQYLHPAFGLPESFHGNMIGLLGTSSVATSDWLSGHWEPNRKYDLDFEADVLESPPGRAVGESESLFTEKVPDKFSAAIVQVSHEARDSMQTQCVTLGVQDQMLSMSSTQ